MAKNSKQQEKDRRAKIEAMRQAEMARERRRSLMFVVLAVLVGFGLIAAAAVPAYLDSQNDPAKKDLASFGVSESAASCTDVETDSAKGAGEHHPTGTKLAYDTVPPAFGPHTENWVTIGALRPFYTEEDRPPLEELVHNLEHGYTILWYDPSVSEKKQDELRRVAESGRAMEEAVSPAKKFLVSAWDDSYGNLPEGKKYVLTHWGGNEQGFRQSCGDLSGAVVKKFLEDHPFSDSPEPAAV